MEVQFEYSQNKFIQFELHDINFIVGPNSKRKKQLLRTISLVKKRKSLSTLEQNYYNNDGININCDDVAVNGRNTNFIVISSADDMINEFVSSKDSLLSSFLNSIKDDFDVQREITKLNDNMIRLENIIQNKINELDDKNRLNLELNLLDYESILKKQLSISYYPNKVNDILFPVEFMPIESISNLFFKILNQKLLEKDTPYWIFIVNPSQLFSSNDALNKFIIDLRQITFKHELLKVFIFLDDFPDFQMNSYDIEKTVYIGDFTEQFPEFDIMKRSVELHYPTEYNLSDEDLINGFYRAINYVGKDIQNIYLSKKDMILFSVLQELL